MNLGSTTMGFNYKTGDSGRSIDLYSAHVPTSFADSIRIGAATGINTASITTPSLMMHMAASNAILQLTDRSRQMNAVPLVLNPWTIGVVVGATGAIYTYGKNVFEERNHSSSSSAVAGGMPDPEDEEGKGRKTNCEKSESTVWKELKPYRGEYRTNTKGDEIYKWDHLHNDIEVFSKRGEHLGSMDPRTGILYKGPKGHSINL